MDILLFRHYGSNTKLATLSTFFNIASIFLFRFIITCLYLYIVVLLLFRFCHFLWRNEVWVQFISVRWVLKYFFYFLISIFFLYQTITLIFFHCAIMFFSQKKSRITSLSVSIIIISHPFFMKNRWLYQSNDISLQLFLCITLKKGYMSNHYFCKSSNRHLNAIFYWKLAELLLGGIIVEKLQN